MGASESFLKARPGPKGELPAQAPLPAPMSRNSHNFCATPAPIGRETPRGSQPIRFRQIDSAAAERRSRSRPGHLASKWCANYNIPSVAVGQTGGEGNGEGVSAALTQSPKYFSPVPAPIPSLIHPHSIGGAAAVDLSGNGFGFQWGVIS